MRAMRVLVVAALAGLFGSSSKKDPSKPVTKSGWTCPSGSQSSKSAKSGPQYHFLEHKGTTRCWIQYVPREAQREPRPVVIDMHPLQATAELMHKSDGFERLAKAEGFIAVWPNGFRRSWNAGGICCGAASYNDIDDVGFLLAMITRLRETLNVDPSRIYVTGHSNGCGMAQRLAVEASAVIAAVACMSGFWTARLPDEAAGALLPMPFLAVHCRDDMESPAKYDPLALRNLQRWRQHDGCFGEPSRVWQNSTSMFELYTECDHGVEAGLVTLEVCGHWPYKAKRPPMFLLNRLIQGPDPVTTMPEDAIQIAWGFLKKFRLRADGGSRQEDPPPAALASGRVGFGASASTHGAHDAAHDAHDDPNPALGWPDPPSAADGGASDAYGTAGARGSLGGAHTAAHGQPTVASGGAPPLAAELQATISTLEASIFDGPSAAPAVAASHPVTPAHGAANATTAMAPASAHPAGLANATAAVAPAASAAAAPAARTGTAKPPASAVAGPARRANITAPAAAGGAEEAGQGNATARVASAAVAAAPAANSTAAPTAAAAADAAAAAQRPHHANVSEASAAAPASAATAAVTTAPATAGTPRAANATAPAGAATIVAAAVKAGPAAGPARPPGRANVTAPVAAATASASSRPPSQINETAPAGAAPSAVAAHLATASNATAVAAAARPTGQPYVLTPASAAPAHAPAHAPAPATMARTAPAASSAGGKPASSTAATVLRPLRESRTD